MRVKLYPIQRRRLILCRIPRGVEVRKLVAFAMAPSVLLLLADCYGAFAQVPCPPGRTFLGKST
jgi:hypothetical protein